jgi:NADPH:quinone reductase-like Zn-dependent oxidoreductase
MKAAVRTKYGLPGDLSIKEINIPIPAENEVLIKVHASTVNRSDCHVLTGRPWFMHLFTGFFKPKQTITGSDFTGQVAAVGFSVRAFAPGNKIMGFGGVFGCGAHAQYFVLPEAKAIEYMIIMPDNLDYEEAAACLEGSYYAACGINHLKPKSGQKALVYGATGAIGSAYVQFFKYYGLYVTAVCDDMHNALMTSLGADKLIDYKTQDFTKDNDQYDYVIDAAGKSSFLKCKKLLNKTGRFSSSGGLENLFFAMVTSLFGRKRVVFVAPKDIAGHLNFIKGLIEKGKFKPVIDRKYLLEEITEAYKYVASGRKIGNVIITMGTEGERD